MSKPKTELTGEYMVMLADKWVEENPAAWGRMTEIAKGYWLEGRRFSMEKLFQHARYDMATNGTSQNFKVNNSTRAALARRMVREHPEFDKLIERRKSKVDL